MSYTLQNGGVNKLLASLPGEDGRYLESIGRLDHPAQGRTLVSRCAPITDLWFPHSGVVALTSTDSSGRGVQTGIVGSEGCVGLEALFGRPVALPDAVVQIEGPMSVIPAQQLRSALLERPSIQTALVHFLYGMSMQSLQTIACNRQHGLAARCCRWLLTIRDCIDSDELPLTQENLAMLLGSGRPRVNGILASLERKGMIHRRRGRLHLLSRPGLEGITCECYRIVHDSSASLAHGLGETLLSRREQTIDT